MSITKFRFFFQLQNFVFNGSWKSFPMNTASVDDESLSWANLKISLEKKFQAIMG